MVTSVSGAGLREVGGVGGRRIMGSNESQYYKPVKTKVEEILKERYGTYHLEITAKKTFGNKLKRKISDYREIIFLFLKEVRPDITGFIEDVLTEFIVIEVKNEPIKLDHIYQVRKYAELLDARYALLVSTEAIPEEIRRLSRVVYRLLSLPADKTMTLVRFNEETGEFDGWFPKNPFEG